MHVDVTNAGEAGTINGLALSVSAKRAAAGGGHQ